MDRNVSDEMDAVRRRLVQRWIAGARTVQGQIHGLVTIAAALTREVETLVGAFAALMIWRRVVILARRQYPLLESPASIGDGMNAARLAEELHGEDPERVREALVGLVETWCLELESLLDGVALRLLQVVEAELAAHEAPAQPDEEDR
ncbi:MAG: hypothetical protein HY331_12200 [Chloroflexi bacterium]|nr:hypothetical protein [Chloroflexota bacterium]